jgi:hypothetical protein
MRTGGTGEQNGTYPTSLLPFDASQTGELIQSLFDAGLDHETVKAVMSGNAQSFMADVLPPKP